MFIIFNFSVSSYISFQFSKVTVPRRVLQLCGKLTKSTQAGKDQLLFSIHNDDHDDGVDDGDADDVDDDDDDDDDAVGHHDDNDT